MKPIKTTCEPAMFFYSEGVVNFIANLKLNNNEKVIAIEPPLFLCGMYGVCVAVRILENKKGEVFKESYVLYINHKNTDLKTHLANRKKVRAFKSFIKKEVA